MLLIALMPIMFTTWFYLQSMNNRNTWNANNIMRKKGLEKDFRKEQ